MQMESEKLVNEVYRSICAQFYHTRRTRLREQMALSTCVSTLHTQCQCILREALVRAATEIFAYAKQRQLN